MSTNEVVVNVALVSGPAAWWLRARAAAARAGAAIARGWRAATGGLFYVAHGYDAVEYRIEMEERTRRNDALVGDLSRLGAERLVKIADLTRANEGLAASVAHARGDRSFAVQELHLALESGAHTRRRVATLSRLLAKRAGRDELKPSEWQALRLVGIAPDFATVRPGTGKAREAARRARAGYRRAVETASADRKRRAGKPRRRRR